ncbi:iron-siderophore ABC transporter substrate-binding protein [Nostoc sp.]|uniref:iron-siderophore ABC transporter substrate-binding protein n=1 Tax=Nostoc sp. TaxID=1180 RepID=UPI002FF8F018
MKPQQPRLIKPLLLMAFSFLLIITACHSPVTQATKTSTRYLAPKSDCQVIQHALDEICIPVNPQRIIALDIPWTLDPLLALGIKPVGTAIYGDESVGFSGLSPDEVAGIELVGLTASPSLEKILALKPDLMLSLDVHDDKNYAQLSAIAPTVLREYDKIKTSFQENFRAIAQLVDQEEKAEKILAQYQKRVEALRKSLGKPLQGTKTSVIQSDGSNFWISPKYTNYFQILNDIGVPLKPIFIKQNESVPFSIEVIDKFDADILFIVSHTDKPASHFLQNPLIASLAAVKNNRAYVVEQAIWYAPYGPLGMNRLLDDISKHLLEAIQTF